MLNGKSLAVMGLLVSLDTSRIKRRFREPSVNNRPDGWYRKFEQRDKRKNYKV